MTDGDQKNGLNATPARCQDRRQGIEDSNGAHFILVGRLGSGAAYSGIPERIFETHERAGVSSRLRFVSRCSGARSCRLRQKPTKAAAGLLSFGLPELAHQSRQSRSSA